MAIINVLGGFGFVGSEYCKISKDFLIKNLRDNYKVCSANVVYFISTVDNYNVHVDSLLDIQTNLVVLMKVLNNYREYIKKTGEKGCFSFISSWFVYGQDSGFGENSRGISETDFCDPKGFYSITKRCAEQLLISYCETFDLNYRILRLANVLGKEDKKVSAKKNALQYLLSEIAANRNINLYDSGRFYRDYIDVRDCAAAIDLIIQNGEENSIYNIGNGKGIVFRDVLEYAKNAMNSISEFHDIEQKEFHKKVQSSRSFFMNNNKLKSLGYSSQYTINQTIDDLISKSE